MAGNESSRDKEVSGGNSGLRIQFPPSEIVRGRGKWPMGPRPETPAKNLPGQACRGKQTSKPRDWVR